MNTNRTVLAIAFSLAIGTAMAWAENEKEIAISKVPKKVIAAAQKAVPGIKLTEAEVQKTGKGVVYEVEGTANGKQYEINVTEGGEVLKVQQDDDDEDSKSTAKPEQKKN
jgi:hypothetical protein